MRTSYYTMLGINCYMPANGETVAIATTPYISVDMSSVLYKRVLEESIGNTS